MNTFRKSIAAVVTAALISTSMVTTFNSADAREFMGRGHGHWGHQHRGGGMRGFGTGMAVGVGLALLGTAIAANNSHAQIHSDAAKQGWTKRNQNRHDCHLVAEWKKLVEAAERALDRDRQMHKDYGEAVHSIEHVNFSLKELDRRREELRKAKARCA